MASEVGDPASAREFASLLTGAGLPTQAPPTRVFRRLFHTMLAIEVARLLAFRAAGWDLDTLAARPDLVACCALAMRAAAHIARTEGGAIAWAASLLPGFVFRLMVKRRATRPSTAFREVWRHHGPKTSARLDFPTRQLLERAGGRPCSALRALLET